jgi:hypothetical protein
MSDSASDLESLRQETKSTVDPVKSFLSGGFGGIACVLVGHPFDLTYVSQNYLYPTLSGVTKIGTDR